MLCLSSSNSYTAFTTTLKHMYKIELACGVWRSAYSPLHCSKSYHRTEMPAVWTLITSILLQSSISEILHPDIHFSRDSFLHSISKSSLDQESRSKSLGPNQGFVPVIGWTGPSFIDMKPIEFLQFSMECCALVPGICNSMVRCTLGLFDCVRICTCALRPGSLLCLGRTQKYKTNTEDDEIRSSPTASGQKSQNFIPLFGVTARPDTLVKKGQSLIKNISRIPLGSNVLLQAVALTRHKMRFRRSSAKFNTTLSPFLETAATLSTMKKPEGQAPMYPTLFKEVVKPPRSSRTTHGGSGTTEAITDFVDIFNVTSANSSQSRNLSHTGKHSYINISGDEERKGLSDNDDPDAFVTIDWRPLLLAEDSCGSECSNRGGRCVLNWEMKSVCENGTAPDPCDSFRCLHGRCVAKDRKYRCHCDPNWVGVLCEKECPLDCGAHGHCGRVQNDSVACICQWNYTGTRCTELSPVFTLSDDRDSREDVVMMWQVAAGCLGAAAVLLVLIVVIAYVTWRRQWLPMRKLIHYFQQYEEDDGKEFDAFISYRSASHDENFVVHHLYPRLEKYLDFKLCMHFRDFPPGETIADNIIHAIEKSRRTILVLSPAYIQSEWCRLEYQKAQHEMLKLKHKIIPVVLENVEHVRAMDLNLKTILDTVTYIKWPGAEDSKKMEKFWKLLELSMPKRKSDYSRSLSSTGSCSSEAPLTSVSNACFDSIIHNMSDTLHQQRSLSFTSSCAAETDNDNNQPDSNVCKSECESSDSDAEVKCLTNTSQESSPKLHDRHHVTSDDHIVEIRELPGNKIKVTQIPPSVTPSSLEMSVC